jgi:hypothetical protein
VHVRCGDREYLRIARKRVLQALRRCDAVSRVMDRISIEMEWGVSLGASNVVVILKINAGGVKS